MSFNSDGSWDIDEQLRVLDLVKPHPGIDLSMLVDNSGTPVAGESVRRYHDGKARLDISAWTWGLVVRAAVGAGARGGRTYTPLVVVRDVDAASASLTSLTHAATAGLKIAIGAFRAGGDQSATDQLPFFELAVEEARISGQFFTTGGPSPKLSEILVIDYRRVTVRTAPQSDTGLRGAVRECEMAAGPPA